MVKPSAPQTETATTIGSDKNNSAPEIEEIILRPDTPRPGDRLTAVVEVHDPDGDPVRLRYAWAVDGNPVDQTGPEIMLKDVEKGSYVEVSVVANDSRHESDVYRAGIRVANQAPVILGVVFEPLGEVSAASDVTAAPRAFDPDGDQVSFRYAWRVNDQEVSSEARLDAREFRRGDQIVLEVVAYDGDDESKALVSAPVTVVNANPKIVSTPAGFGGERFRYNVEVDDPDGDRNPRFHLLKGPNGMRIDDLSGSVSWNPDSDQEGSHLVVILVEDQKGGKTTQRFELTLGTGDDDSMPASPSP